MVESSNITEKNQRSSPRSSQSINRLSSQSNNRLTSQRSSSRNSSINSQRSSQVTNTQQYQDNISTFILILLSSNKNLFLELFYEYKENGRINIDRFTRYVSDNSYGNKFNISHLVKKLKEWFDYLMQFSYDENEPNKYIRLRRSHTPPPHTPPQLNNIIFLAVYQTLLDIDLKEQARKEQERKEQARKEQERKEQKREEQARINHFQNVNIVLNEDFMKKIL